MSLAIASLLTVASACSSTRGNQDNAVGGGVSASGSSNISGGGSSQAGSGEGGMPSEGGLPASSGGVAGALGPSGAAGGGFGAASGAVDLGGTGAIDLGGAGVGLGAAAGSNAASGASGSNSAGSGGAAPGDTSPAVSKDGETLLSSDGLTIITDGGFMNGESFQRDGVVTFKGYQYAAFWNTKRHIVLGRRVLPSGAWVTLELTDYTNFTNDAHNTISIGICPGDGTMHLAFDEHNATLNYRKSIVGLVSSPDPATWVASSFLPVSSALIGNTVIKQLTYPQFITEPGGDRMLFQARLGEAGSGDQYLWEYSSATHAFQELGRYVNGTVNSVNGYPHGLYYAKSGTRLYTTWCWRELGPSTNHDLLYASSDDNGRTWQNSAGASIGTTGSSPMSESSAGVKVWTISQNRGMINQEHMAVDAAGRVHVLLSHLPDSEPDESNFDTARTKSQYFHYWRSPSGAWARDPMGLPAVALHRGKLAVSTTDNLYAILPDLRIAATSAQSNFSKWVVLNATDSGRFFSDPLIDTQRLLTEDKLTIIYPQKASSNIYDLEYSLR